MTPHPEMRRYIELAAANGHRYLPNRLYAYEGSVLVAEYRLPNRVKEADGKHLCGWCAGPIPKGRSLWCGQACVDQFLIRRGGTWLKSIVHKRDRGVCAACGLDTEEIAALKKQLFYKRRVFWEDPPMSAWLPESRQELLKQWGPWSRYGVLWEADHIVPVIEGGGCCGLENLRTLCLACHARETKALAGRRARAKRAQLEFSEVANG